MYKVNILTIYIIFTCLPAEHAGSDEGDAESTKAKSVITRNRRKHNAMKINTVGGHMNVRKKQFISKICHASKKQNKKNVVATFVL